MWLFGFKRKAVTPSSNAPAAAPPGPQLVRRTEITVEREWTSTVVRRPVHEGSGPMIDLPGKQQVEGDE